MPTKLRGKRTGLLRGLIVGYGLFLALLTAMNGFGADRWWVGALNLYLPQGAWLAPIILLALLSWRQARRWLWVLGCYFLWVCGPIMGFCWSFPVPQQSLPMSSSVRVMTCNIKYGQRDVSALLRDIDRYQPDVVLLQDATHLMKGPLESYFRDWNVIALDQYAVASRLPLAKAEIRSLSFPDDPGTCNAQASCLRTELLLGNIPVTLYNVHLLTPRRGLNAFRVARKRPGLFREAIQDLQDNVECRLSQARVLSTFVRQEPGAVIVAGDLNSPDDSLVGGALKEAGLHNAFAEGGRGYGYTYGHLLLTGRMPWLPGLSWMRIDHVLLSPGIRSLRCWTGTGKASDHRPVFADLIVSTL